MLAVCRSINPTLHHALAQHWTLNPRFEGRSMPRKTMTTQLELFPETLFTAATPTPPWQSLPANTRQALTQLMARLMTEHAGAAGGENDHEA